MQPRHFHQQDTGQLVLGEITHRVLVSWSIPHQQWVLNILSKT